MSDPWMERARLEYGPAAESMRWATAEDLDRHRASRDALVAELVGGGARVGAGGSKLWLRELSPGCETCAAGTWACLFVNGTCNGRCFFCPAPQDEVGEPVTSTVPFPDPADLVAYARAFGIRGVGLSGGEPLLTPERTEAFVRAVRAGCPDVYVWMYTNGVLATPERLRPLVDAGLHEVRFNLAATGYATKHLALAVGVVPRVTVEIPAVPEDEARLLELVEELDRLGVRHLHLHGLRPTPHSVARFAGRPYTFVAGPRVSVLESELVALRVLRHAMRLELRVAAHYCASVYQHRWQERATRARFAPSARRPHEDVAATGLLRDLWVQGPEAAAVRAALEARDPARATWSVDTGKRVHLRARHLDLVPAGADLRGAWWATHVSPRVTYRFPFQAVTLDTGRQVVVERRQVAADVAVGVAERAALAALDRGEEADPGALAAWERMEEGLG